VKLYNNYLINNPGTGASMQRWDNINLDFMSYFAHLPLNQLQGGDYRGNNYQKSGKIKT